MLQVDQREVNMTDPIQENQNLDGSSSSESSEFMDATQFNDVDSVKDIDNIDFQPIEANPLRDSSKNFGLIWKMLKIINLPGFG